MLTGGQLVDNEEIFIECDRKKSSVLDMVTLPFNNIYPMFQDYPLKRIVQLMECPLDLYTMQSSQAGMCTLEIMDILMSSKLEFECLLFLVFRTS